MIKKYEYLVIRGFSGFKRNIVNKKLNNLGNDGWELVGIDFPIIFFGFSFNIDSSWIFKRELK